MFEALAHDFVLRRNVRIGYSCLEAEDGTDLGKTFLASTHGLHRIALIDGIARHWNTLIDTHKRATGLAKRPRLTSVQSGEVFGIVDSANAATFGGLFDIKEECISDEVPLLESDLSGPQSAMDVLEHLSIDSSLLTQPLVDARLEPATAFATGSTAATTINVALRSGVGGGPSSGGVAKEAVSSVLRRLPLVHFLLSLYLSYTGLGSHQISPIANLKHHVLSCQA